MSAVRREERFVAVGAGVELRILDEGPADGVPVMLLHGFPDRAEMWREVVVRLHAAGRRTLAVDLPGYGESTIPATCAGYRCERVADQLIAALDGLGVTGPIDLAGHDWGAYQTWIVALRHPQRVRRIAAISVGHPNSFVRAVRTGVEQLARSWYFLPFQAPELAARALAAGDHRLLRAWLGGANLDEGRIVADMSRPGRLAAGLRWYAVNVPRAFRRWPRCTVPALGLWPTGDRYLGERQLAGSAAELDAEWRYAPIPGAGHWAPLEAPDEVSRQLLEWFAPPPAPSV